MFGKGKKDKNKQPGNQEYYSCFHAASVAAGVWQWTSPLILILVNRLHLKPDKKSREGYQFKLLPVLRIIDTEVASARTIEGGCKAP